MTVRRCSPSSPPPPQHLPPPGLLFLPPTALQTSVLPGSHTPKGPPLLGATPVSWRAPSKPLICLCLGWPQLAPQHASPSHPKASVCSSLLPTAAPISFLEEGRRDTGHFGRGLSLSDQVSSCLPSSSEPHSVPISATSTATGTSRALAALLPEFSPPALQEPSHPTPPRPPPPALRPQHCLPSPDAQLPLRLGCPDRDSVSPQLLQSLLSWPSR